MKSIDKNHLIVSVVVIATFIIAYESYLSKFISYFFGSSYQDFSPEIRLINHYLSWLIPIVLAVLGLNQFNYKSLFIELGLISNFTKGVVFAFLATLPMSLGYAFTSDLSENISSFFVLRNAILPGIMEEILFRGFLFGLLFHRAGWGFIPAVGINAIFFGISHLHQSSDLSVSLGIFFVTLLGGGWFAWLYIEWDDCLWLPIGLHIFMNLWWDIFDMADTALGGTVANIFRVLTIVITVVITLQKRRKIGSFRITKKNLLYHASGASHSHQNES